MNKPKLVVGITQGDSNGIGYEVLIKSLADSRILDSFTPVVYGSSKIFGFYRKQIHEIEQMDTYVIHSSTACPRTSMRSPASPAPTPPRRRCCPFRRQCGTSRTATSTSS